MPLALASTSFLLALLAAAAMGLALQRGATCTVAAVHDRVHARRAARLWALLEAALWVGAGLAVARALGLQPALPAAPPLTAWTLLGAVLLAAGALVNGACVFGAVARLGTGDWAYLATPLGFYAGCLSAPAGWLPAAHAPLPVAGAALPTASPWLLAGAAAAAGLRLAVGARMHWRRGGWWQAPSPHAATAAIGLAFLALLLLAGAWTYTDVLADLARHMAAGTGTAVRVALALAVLAGALGGGWMARSWRWQRPSTRAVLRCLAGGWLLGWGSLLVPGGNDSLVLVGLPLLWPHAWASVVLMCAVIAAVFTGQRWWQQQRLQPAGSNQV